MTSCSFVLGWEENFELLIGYPSKREPGYAVSYLFNLILSTNIYFSVRGCAAKQNITFRISTLGPYTGKLKKGRGDISPFWSVEVA